MCSTRSRAASCPSHKDAAARGCFSQTPTTPSPRRSTGLTPTCSWSMRSDGSCTCSGRRAGSPRTAAARWPRRGRCGASAHRTARREVLCPKGTSSRHLAAGGCAVVPAQYAAEPLAARTSSSVWPSSSASAQRNGAPDDLPAQHRADRRRERSSHGEPADPKMVISIFEVRGGIGMPNSIVELYEVASQAMLKAQGRSTITATKPSRPSLSRRHRRAARHRHANAQASGPAAGARKLSCSF